VHVLPGMRERHVARQMPQLRRRAGVAAAPTGGQARETSALERARLQACRMREAEGRVSDDFLDSYGGQSTEELLALAGKYRIDSLVLAFEQAIQQKAAPSKEESYVLAVEGLEREVNNGGYRQFFDNSSNQYAGIIVEALQAIGCPKTAAMTADAIAGHGDEKKLAACDDRYYANDEPIADRLFAWIGNNRARIQVP
jgi:hypothetical protein